MFSVIKNSRVKDKCQVFTPEKQVIKMLDLAGYTKKLYGKKFLENSCGNGEILIQAVIRYIDDCKKKSYSKYKIKKGLENDIVAYEVDEQRVEECKKRLNKITLRYEINDVSWDIRCKDFLASKNDETYDFIVGNPPYIAYPDLPSDVQNFVKDNFVSCKKGKFDYNYAFIEKSYSQLKDQGTLVYIIPSNIFKNVFAGQLRNLIKNDIYSIDDFPNDTVFEKVLVSPAIIKIVKGVNTKELIYRLASSEKKIDKSTLGKKWLFNDKFKRFGTKIGDYFKVSSSVATLLNEAFIIKGGIISNGFYEINDGKIEMALLKKAASPKNKKYEKFVEYIIFPYFYDANGILQHYSEEEMYYYFPCAMKYLENYKKALEKRASDKSAKWFEYGRSQALQNINQQVILISSVISSCTQAYLLQKGEIPYSGLYIIPKGNIPLNELLPILNSDDFRKYINSVGVCVSGTSKRVTPSDIENYIFEIKSHKNDF